MSGYGYGICPCHTCTCSGCNECDPPEQYDVEPIGAEPAEPVPDPWAELDEPVGGAA